MYILFLQRVAYQYFVGDIQLIPRVGVFAACYFPVGTQGCPIPVLLPTTPAEGELHHKVFHILTVARKENPQHETGENFLRILQ